VRGHDSYGWVEGGGTAGFAGAEEAHFLCFASLILCLFWIWIWIWSWVMEGLVGVESAVNGVGRCGSARCFGVWFPGFDLLWFGPGVEFVQ
jgi:hypothetical protein